MSKRNSTCTSGSWGVSVTSVDGRHILKIYRRLNGSQKFLTSQYFGMEFSSPDAAFEFALQKGYLHYYNRNIVSFISNRSYRKHTNRMCVEDDQFGNSRFYLSTVARHALHMIDRKKVF